MIERRPLATVCKPGPACAHDRASRGNPDALSWHVAGSQRPPTPRRYLMRSLSIVLVALLPVACTSAPDTSTQGQLITCTSQPGTGVILDCAPGSGSGSGTCQDVDEDGDGEPHDLDDDQPTVTSSDDDDGDGISNENDCDEHEGEDGDD